MYHTNFNNATVENKAFKKKYLTLKFSIASIGNGDLSFKIRFLIVKCG